jgi:two-component system, NarL family, invasion response regulator UvrY
MSSITIVIADAQPLCRDGLKLLLQPKKEIKIVAEAACRKQLFQALQQHQPDIVIIDYNLPEYFTHEDIEDIHQLSPHSRIVILSSDHDKLTIFQVLEAGVNGFLTKECSKEQVIRAIDAAARGERFFCNKVLEVLLEMKIPKNEPDPEPTVLSERETEITQLIGTGKSTKEVADELFISIHTVRTHRKNILKKLGINSISELVLYAVHAGLVPTGEQ